MCQCEIPHLVERRNFDTISNFIVEPSIQLRFPVFFLVCVGHGIFSRRRHVRGVGWKKSVFIYVWCACLVVSVCVFVYACVCV